MQKTIKNSVSISGRGLHTGKNVTITFRPAGCNHGYKFKRIDRDDQPVIDATIDNVTDTSRGTSIEKNGIKIGTVEHVLAALFGVGIDNVMMDIDGPEAPILDGSSVQIVNALLRAGIVEQDFEKQYYDIHENVTYKDPEKGVEIIAIPSDKFRLSVLIDYDDKVLSNQFAELSSLDSFVSEIAPCRTFVFLHELEPLIRNNLIKGGDLDNAIVFVNKIISQDELDNLSRFFNKPKVQVLKEGILNNLELNFSNEPARHKLLDMVGDLALMGKSIKCHIIAKRPGHYSNIQFARKLNKYIHDQINLNSIPRYDLNKPPLYDVTDIQRMLPHRPPFLFVDRILELNDNYVVGMKNVTMNESFFVGHFPDDPIMPGVLQVEAMAQVGGIYALSRVPDPENYTTLFMKFEDVRFRNKVTPGDTLIFVLKLLFPIRRGIVHMKGIAYIGDKIASEGEFLAQIVKKKN